MCGVESILWRTLQVLLGAEVKQNDTAKGLILQQYLNLFVEEKDLSLHK